MELSSSLVPSLLKAVQPRLEWQAETTLDTYNKYNTWKHKHIWEIPFVTQGIHNKALKQADAL